MARSRVDADRTTMGAIQRCSNLHFFGSLDWISLIRSRCRGAIVQPATRQRLLRGNIALRNQIELEEVCCKSANFRIQVRDLRT
jgi:hypothetical protein